MCGLVGILDLKGARPIARARLRRMAEGAKGQLREQMGPEFDDINWKQYDPRQYDPRRIVREALFEPDVEAEATGHGADPSPVAHDPSRATPYDVDAT